MQITQIILDHFKFEEGYQLTAYTDSQDNYTIGIGHLLGPNAKYRGTTWTDRQVMQTFQNDLNVADTGIRQLFPEFDRFSEGLQLGLLDMTFQMGESHVAGFRMMIQAIHDGKFQEAADDALQSAWARETPHRAHRTTELIRAGYYVN